MQWYLNNYPLGNPQINYLVKSSKTSVGNFQKSTKVLQMSGAERQLPKLWLRFVIFKLPAQFWGQFGATFVVNFGANFWVNFVINSWDNLEGNLEGNTGNTFMDNYLVKFSKSSVGNSQNNLFWIWFWRNNSEFQLDC